LPLAIAPDPVRPELTRLTPGAPLALEDQLDACSFRRGADGGWEV